MKNGFTLIELVVVLAIISILGAIITPSLLSQLEGARLRSDVQSVRIIQNALELYRMDKGKAPTAITATGVITELKGMDYLKNINDTPQVHKAEFTYDKKKVEMLLDLSACTSSTKKVALELSTQDRVCITGAK